MLVFAKKKQEVCRQKISVREAFTLWDILTSKYMAMNRILIWENFAHDKDLVLVLKLAKKPFDKNILILESLMDEFAIESPDRNMTFENSPVNPRIVTDEFIALDVFLYLQEHVENMLKAVRSSISNDSVRKTLKTMFFDTVNELDKYALYLRAKGWIAVPPRYPHVPRENYEEGFSDFS